jgi:hypothetical protein
VPPRDERLIKVQREWPMELQFQRKFSSRGFKELMPAPVRRVRLLLSL